jgi:PelA/Pel-15E family pectate lyase
LKPGRHFPNGSGFLQFPNDSDKIDAEFFMARANRALEQHIRFLAWLLLYLALPAFALGQVNTKPARIQPPDTAGFSSGSNHWYNIADEEHTIDPLPTQRRHRPDEVEKIADNILLYQKENGGWPKNYDMMAELTVEQKKALLASRTETNTTIDNGATYEQIRYLAKAYQRTQNPNHRDACLRGLDFLLDAQYPNGGWPQFFPDTSGYRKYITFNDGAMIGVMQIFWEINQGTSHFGFVDAQRRARIKDAFERGIDAILKCQIVENGVPTAWCQQHDNRDFRPQHARSYELPSICGAESAEIVLFLMQIQNPSARLVKAVEDAVQWFKKAQITGLKVEEVKAPKAQFMFHSADFDRVVVKDPSAPPIWARFYQLGTGRPLFSNRDGKPVYSLAEVDRERRTGYGWYTYDPARVMEKYPAWKKKWAPSPDEKMKE